jgi:hypothetical protein
VPLNAFGWHSSSAWTRKAREQGNRLTNYIAAADGGDVVLALAYVDVLVENSFNFGDRSRIG